MKAVIVFMTVMILSGIRQASAEGTVASVIMSGQTWNRMYHLINDDWVVWGKYIFEHSASHVFSFFTTTYKPMIVDNHLLLSGRVETALAENANAVCSVGFL